MNETKHTMISEQLETDLLSGLFEEKIPSVRTLSARFEVSTRTINKAIKTLTAKGLVIPAGSSGILVNKNRNICSKTGNIVIFCNRDHIEVNHDVLLEEISDAILSSGMRPVFMKVPHPEIFNDENFWKSGWVDGYIFVYSSFDRQFAHRLTRINVPFVVANMVPDEYGVNWVDFDNDEMHLKIFHKIAELNYRKICYCATMHHPDAHRKSTLKLIGSIKQEFMLNVDFCLSQYGDPNVEITPEIEQRHIQMTIRQMLELENTPELVIAFYSPAILRKEMDSAGLKNVPILAVGLTALEYESQKEFPCVIHSYHELAQGTFSLFKKVLKDPKISPEHTLIPYKYHLEALKANQANKYKEIAVF